MPPDRLYGPYGPHDSNDQEPDQETPQDNSRGGQPPMDMNMPSAPYTPNNSPVYDVAPARSRKNGFLALLAVIILVGIAYGMYVLLSANQKNPDKLFQTALETALSTKSYTEVITDPLSQGALNRKIDVSDFKKIHLSGTATFNAPGATKLQGYGTMQNSYINMSQDGVFNAPSQSLNLWVQVRKNGAIITNDNSGLSSNTFGELFSPTLVVHEPIVHGNFSAADRKSIVTLIKEKSMFTYDAAKVTEETLDGQPVTRYETTINQAAQQELLKKVAGLAGLSTAAISAELGKHDYDNPVVVYIQTKTHRIVKIETGTGDKKSVVNYSDFDATSTSSEPSPVYDWNAYARLLGQQAVAP